MDTLPKKLGRLLDVEDRRSFTIFIAISFLAGVIEVIGIGSIMPFIGVLMQPDIIKTNHILAAMYDRLQFEDTRQFLVVMGCATLCMIALGGIVNIFNVRYQLRVTHRIGHKWAVRLFSTYLHQPYKFYLKTNTNTMKSTILSEVDRVVSSVLVPVAVIISKTMVISILLLLLMFVNPVITALLVLITGGIYASLLFYFRNKMRIRGRDAVRQNAIRFKTTSEAFASIRDIKLHDNAGFFEGEFSRASEKYTTSQAYSLYHGQVPRFIIETAGFVILITLVLYLIVSGGKNVSDVIPLIALFAASGYKVLPAAQNLYSSFNSIRFNSAGLDFVSEGMSLPVQAQDEGGARLPFSSEIRVDGVTFTYDDRTAPTLNEVSALIRKNNLVGVVGPTGAGKSTFIDILIGLLSPQSGAVLVDGGALNDSTIKSWQRQIGYVPQQIHLLTGSIGSNIAFGKSANHADPAKIADAAQKAHIDSFIATLPDGYETDVGEHGDRLSGGQRQRIGIARALYRDPEILVLDEPTSALDAETARNLILTLKVLSQKKTVIIITHQAETLEHCDQVLMVEDGRIRQA
ncbi:MAG: Lipid export ATP-binding/permease protein MsbA [Micavibrio sp.]|nr:Lipid export ATP-binding/permease protein MsbA [Micavibrio sp.]